MQNNKLQKIFFRTFLITLICVVFVVGIGIASFALIDKMFGEETEQKPVSSALELNIITDITHYMGNERSCKPCFS